MPGGADADGVRQYAVRCGCRILVYMICAWIPGTHGFSYHSLSAKSSGGVKGAGQMQEQILQKLRAAPVDAGNLRAGGAVVFRKNTVRRNADHRFL